MISDELVNKLNYLFHRVKNELEPLAAMGDEIGFLKLLEELKNELRQLSQKVDQYNQEKRNAA